MQILPVTMISLPMPTCWPEPVLAVPASSPPKSSIGGSGVEDEQFLLRAFRSFADAAGSLERSYGMLRAEVERLRRELEVANGDLARSLEENRSMRAHLDQIVENLPCGVLVVSSDGQISKMNPEAVRMLGADTPGAELVSVSGLSAGVQQLLLCARREGSEQELGVPGEDGSIRWLAARHASIGESASVFILRDVSERKRLEEAQARLRREQALAEVSAVLAHEIRNPLGSLELFAGLLADSQLGPECGQWVEHLQAGLRTLSATVNNVLHFHSQPELERAPVDLGRLLEWARDFFMPLAHQSNIVLGLQNRVSGVLFPADRHRLEQVLLNLVLNSIRAMSGGGWIELAGREVQNGEAVALVVSDAGPGISPESLSRIFDPGFSTRAGSPGLGLAVCRKIVEQHGGTIIAESRPACGGTFTITFPLARKSAEGAVE